MNLGTLRKQVPAWLERNVFRVVDTGGPVGRLSPSEHATIHGLMEVITDDCTVTAAECRAFVNEKTLALPGVLDAYRRAAQLLEDASQRHLGKGFSQAAMAERNELLQRLFIAFPHHERLPRWARRAHLSPYTLSLLIEFGSFRSLRHHVMPELLSWYYTTERGWAMVGWTDFPGKPRRH